MAQPSFAYRATVTVLTISAIVYLTKIGGMIADILMLGLCIWLIRKFGIWKRANTLGQLSVNTPQTRSHSPELKVSLSKTRTPTQPSVSPDKLWIKNGESVEIYGQKFEGGFLYVGENLHAIGNDYQEEPALINPKYKVQNILTADYRIRHLSYWPTYSGASPEARSAYLSWLLKGKNDRGADIGYVFLYYYGLERRALADAEISSQAKLELPLIEQEIRRLLTLYSGNGSFKHYASDLLNYLGSSDVPEKIYLQPPLQLSREIKGLPFVLKLALGQLTQDEQPVPVEWAYAWVMAEPTIRLRTPVQRCHQEFKSLFMRRYQEKLGSGLKLTKNKTHLKLEYQVASPSFSHRIFTRSLNLPDVSVLSSPLKKLQEIVDNCTSELESYSRFLGRNPEKANTFEAMLERPLILWSERYTKKLGQIKAHIEGTKQPLEIPFTKFRSWFPDWNDFSKPRLTLFALRISELGLGMEPDPRFGGDLSPDNRTVVLFVDDGKFVTPSQCYSIVALSLSLAVSVADADGDIGAAEKGLLTKQLEKWLHLEEPERQRLHAHLHWLLAEKPRLSGVKKRVESLSPEARQTLGDFLTEVAHADNQVTAGEVKMLEKIFKLLELDSKLLYNKLHQTTNEPFTVQPAEAVASGFTIPKPPQKLTSLQLDMGKITALKAESERVSSILGSIFAKEPDNEINAEELTTDNGLGSLEQEVMGLDSRHSDLVKLLSTRVEWPRAELEEIMTDRKLVLDGVLEHINEAAFNHANMPFTEGDDPIEINQDLVKELYS